MVKMKIIRAEVVKLHPAIRAFTDSFIVSTQGKTTQSISEPHHCIIPLRTYISLREN